MANNFLAFRMSGKIDYYGNMIFNNSGFQNSGFSPSMTITERQWIYEAGIGYFFDENFNLMADQDVDLISTSLGCFGGCACKSCGCPIENLRANMDNKEYWMKNFRVPDTTQYFENEVIRKACGVNLDIMKQGHSSDPNKALGKYNMICPCKNCKKISK